MATTLDDQIGRVLGGRYRLVAPVGSGASAQVFLADDTTLRRRVAVKMLHQGLATDETFLRRFRAEARAAAAMNHPHIMAVYDWGEDDVPYLVSEYLGGGSLRAMLDVGPPLSVSQALIIGLEAARGLEYAHRQKVIHRDIKPANLLFDDEGRLRIADFGIARALAEAGWTEEGAVVGTARYSSPEQAKSDPLTGKSDVYALGLVLIEAVTGEVPFGGETAISTLVARIDEQVPVPAELGPLRAVLERALVDLIQTIAPTATEFIIGLMAAAEECDRPAPLPLVGAIPRDMSVDDRAPIDPTEVAISPVLAPPTSDTTRVFQREERSPQPRFTPPPPPQPFVDEDDNEPRRRWPWVVLSLLIVAAIAGGVFAYFATRTISHVVPEMRGETVEVLQAAAAKNKWELADPPQQLFDPEVAPGLVLKTNPAAGEKLAENAILEYTVSLGPEPVVIPTDLAGKTLDEAAAALSAVGLTLAPDPTPKPDEEVPPGHVIGLNTTELQALPGTPIPVVVSSGPAPRTIDPAWVGAPFDAVAAQMQQARITPTRVDAFNETVPRGNVVGFKTRDGATDLVPGTEVARDSSVQVIVSNGRAPRAVPNVRDKTGAEAIKMLEAEGFTVEVSGDATKKVLETEPRVGTLASYGSKIILVMRKNN